MKCSQTLMNIAVVSVEGHSPWLKQWTTLLLEHILKQPMALVHHCEYKRIVPFTLKLHVFDAFFFDVVSVIKAGCVCQIHKQTHFYLHSSN